MPEACKHTLQDLDALREQISRDIYELQLLRLPHPQLFMLFERSTELSACLEACVQITEEQQNSSNSIQISKAIKELSTLLQHIRANMAESLSIAQEALRFEHYPHQLVQLKNKAKQLASIMGETIQKQGETKTVSQLCDAWSELTAEVQRLKTITQHLCNWALPKIATGLQGIEKVFSMLEQHPALSPLASKVHLALSQNAHQKLAESEYFDQAFYMAQCASANTSGLDPIDHYLNSGESLPPHPMFNPQHYSKAYPEAVKLRYSSLEHFVRYGEVMNYSPGPDFDCMYYLKENEDILDANFPPFRHFLQHGVPESRPPHAKAGAFFAKTYLHPKVARVCFVGSVEKNCHEGWDMLRDHCSTRKACHAEYISATEWTGEEEHLDAYIVGTEGLKVLNNTILQAIAHRRVKILYWGDNPQKDLQELLEQTILPLERICALTVCYERFIRWQESDRQLALHYYQFSDPDLDILFIEALLNRMADKENLRLRRIGQWGTVQDEKPAISVVSIIYKKIREMKSFLEALNRQDLARPYEVVLVDDASPDNSVEEIEAWLEEKRSSGVMNKFMSVRILRNAANSGNCTSRNRGVEAALAEIVLVADGDVAQSTSNLSDHLWEYRLGDCDAVVGFYRFNINYDEVFQWLAACEINSDIVQTKLLLDRESDKRLLPNSIYRYVTRNTSFRKSAFNGYYFDELFNYTSAPNSGYGKEDREIAARLYFERKNIRFAENSVCVHMRHGDNSNNIDKSLANLRNWNRLIDKYPSLTLVDRQYYQWRTRDLLAKNRSKPNAPEVVNARTRFHDPARVNVVLPQSKRLKILTFPGDIAYQYDLFKMHHIFTLLGGADGRSANAWNYDIRPMPYNVLFTSQESFDPLDYDLAIVPFDESLLITGNADDKFAQWGRKLSDQLSLTKGMPRLLLCTELESIFAFSAAATSHSLQAEKRRAILRTLLQDEHVVCTSYQQQKIWNFTKSSVVWHGFSPQEYPEGTHQKSCLTLPRVQEEKIEKILSQLEIAFGDTCQLEYMNIPEPHIGHKETNQAWAVAKYQLYTSYLGKYKMHCAPLPYPSIPTACAESMLTGSIPIALRSEDTEMFITNGTNGFCGDSIIELASYIQWLSKNEKQRAAISRSARLSAMDVFNVDRFLAKWLNLILRML